MANGDAHDTNVESRDANGPLVFTFHTPINKDATTHIKLPKSGHYLKQLHQCVVS